MENTDNAQATPQAEPRSDTAVGSNPLLADISGRYADDVMAYVSIGSPDKKIIVSLFRSAMMEYHLYLVAERAKELCGSPNAAGERQPTANKESDRRLDEAVRQAVESCALACIKYGSINGNYFARVCHETLSLAAKEKSL